MSGQVKNPLRLGDRLIEDGLITKDQLNIALLEQKRTGEMLGRALVTLGFISQSIIRDIVGSATGQSSIDLDALMVDKDAQALISQELARRYMVFPVSYSEECHELTLAMSDTFDIVAIDRVKAALGTDTTVKPVLAAESQIETAIDRYYGFELSIDGILGELEAGDVDSHEYHGTDDSYSHPMVRLVDALLSDAAKRGSSDIHFEPEDGFLRIRYRIDGVLRQIRSLHNKYWAAISVRLKVISSMNIAETRIPQDGRISRNVSGRMIDFRVSTQPTLHGENIVMRILDRSKGITPLDKLDLEPQTLTTIKLMLARPEGIILVTGPTGSGKTTTLYSVLNHLNNDSVNIMTLEDPVEYPMRMIRQSSIGMSSKMGFAEGIRSLMRQDPDIILVGEVRDLDTATMAFRAAMTGHQVFSTLHTNSAVGVFPRLLDIGVSPDIISGNLIGIVAQRLLRKLCVHCREPYTPEEIEQKMLGADDSASPVIYRANGCDRCEHQGYKGRTAIVEVLKMDQELDDLVSRRESIHKMEAYAREKGFHSLADAGIVKVLDGTTSFDELARTVDLTALV